MVSAIIHGPDGYEYKAILAVMDQCIRDAVSAIQSDSAMGERSRAKIRFVLDGDDAVAWCDAIGQDPVPDRGEYMGMYRGMHVYRTDDYLEASRWEWDE